MRFNTSVRVENMQKEILNFHIRKCMMTVKRYYYSENYKLA
jgi:hypothetical protein